MKSKENEATMATMQAQGDQSITRRLFLILSVSLFVVKTKCTILAMPTLNRGQ